MKGVIGPSPLQELVGFHATTSLPRDVMHDFIEGICPVIIISLLKQASALRILTYSEIVFVIFRHTPNPNGLGLGLVLSLGLGLGLG